jgi:hypothetical protein
MALEVSRHLCGDVTVIKLALPDRRGAREIDQQWLFLRHVELCLYGDTSGAINKLLGRCGCMYTLIPRPQTHAAPTKARIHTTAHLGNRTFIPQVQPLHHALALKAGSVGTLCTREELTGLIKLMEEDLPFESKGRVRNAGLWNQWG